MRIRILVIMILLLWTLPLQAKMLTVVLKDSAVLQGDLLGVTAEKLVLQVEQKAKTISRADIQEIFDAESKAKLEYGQLLSAGGVKSTEPEEPVEPETQGLIKPADASAAKNPEGHFVILVQGTMLNSYNRGKLDKWFAELTGIPDDAVDAGASTFFRAGLELDFEIDAGFEMGAGLDLIFPASHSLWGSNLFYGGRQELVLDPQIISVNMPFRILLDDDMRLWLKLIPGLLLGWVSGYYTSPWYDLEFTPAPGIGFGIAGGVDMFFGENFGVNLDLGLRILEVDLMFVDANSTTGYSQPLLNNGELVTVDLGGMYMVAGIILRF